MHLTLSRQSNETHRSCKLQLNFISIQDISVYPVILLNRPLINDWYQNLLTYRIVDKIRIDIERSKRALQLFKMWITYWTTKYKTSELADQSGCTCYFIVNVWIVIHKWSYVEKNYIVLSNEVYVYYYLVFYCLFPYCISHACLWQFIIYSHRTLFRMTFILLFHILEKYYHY
jgi:hypothetical protein